MFITSREKAIIELITKTSGKHTALSIAAFLDVSVRTIHRDLKTVEKILEQFGLRLVRNMDEGLVIEGKNEQIFRLVQYLMKSHPIDQTPKERKLLVLLNLIQEESYKIRVLAAHLGISTSTLSTYLDELAEWLENYDVRLTRKRGVGVGLTGTEESKRKALASYFLHHFYEELMESLYILEKGKSSQAEEKILQYFQADYLLEANRVIMFSGGQSHLADSDYIGLIVHTCITMQRTEAQFLLEKEAGYIIGDLTDEFKFITEICSELENKFPVTFTKEDKNYLAMILKGSRPNAAEAVPYDSILLGKKIKKLIQHVSSQLHVDLTLDFSLFQGLLAHMESSLFRIKQQMSFFNPLKEEIKKKYPLLFMAVKNGLEKEFKDIGDYPDDEIAFIVLHFGSALVMQEEAIPIKALVICPTGIGTSKMLASRIKKEIIEVDSVEIKSIKDIQQQDDLQRYDIIISTVRLPFVNKDYILVSPLLTDENIESIKSFLRKNIERFMKTKHYTKPAPVPSTKKRSLTEELEDLKDVQKGIEAIIQNFRFYRLPHLKGYEEILAEMVRMAEVEKLLTHSDEVLNSLKDREKKGGLGIPNTGIALYHTRHEGVKELIFQVCHLEQPCLIKGMDGKMMYMKSLLLMLAPEELSERAQEIVSLVSTSLIENDESIMIFSSSNETLIKTKLESIFLEYLHTKIIRE